MPIARPAATPAALRRRRYSFATEYYRAFAWSHLAVLAALSWAFPDPLAATRRELRRAGFDPVPAERGDPVRGSLGEGRFVGRHPTSGAPIVAWDAGAYRAMCAAFDEENRHRIAAHQELARRYRWETADCAARALQVDRAIRWLVLLGVGLPPVVSLALGNGQALLWMITAGAVIGVGLGALIFASFVTATPIAALFAAIAGGRAARLIQDARGSDDAGRSSAAEVLREIKVPRGQEESPR